jgi:hypothetical protein
LKIHMAVVFSFCTFSLCLSLALSVLLWIKISDYLFGIINVYILGYDRCKWEMVLLIWSEIQTFHNPIKNIMESSLKCANSLEINVKRELINLFIMHCIMYMFSLPYEEDEQSNYCISILWNIIWIFLKGATVVQKTVKC